VRCECIVGVAEVGVGYAVLLAKVDVVLRCGVAVGVVVGTVAEGVAFGIPYPCRDELPVIGVGVECRWGAVSRANSCLTGYDEVADAEDAARTRPACVSRRRLGPSLTFGWVWHCSVC
jgi:hypothetical protein